MLDSRKPHEALEGLTLPNGWRVEGRITPGDQHTGGYFSCGYVVRKSDGSTGYLKALDFFSGLPESDDPARTLEPLIAAFNFERDLLERCRENRLSRVVTALDTGAVTPPGFSGVSTVQYIIFELAETDLRGLMSAVQELDVAMALRALHHIAVGLEQLHGLGIVHQDLKPSNVLLFNGMRSSKLADLGRAASRGAESPHYELAPAGHAAYAPPEMLYGGPNSSWESRRLGCDVYHLGSMISSIFTTIGMTPLIMYGLDAEQHWRNWAGGWTSALLFLRPAFAEAVDYVVREVPVYVRPDIRGALSALCDPDPALRGYPRSRGNTRTQFSVRRYVSLFNRLASKAEIQVSLALRRHVIAG